MAIVYIHRRNDIQDAFLNVFYVGIGKNTRRAYDKRKNDRSDFWRKIVAKSGYAIEITHTNLCWEEACAIEKYLICFYGRRDIDLGNLCNLTDGGDGSIGHINSKSSNLKKSITIKNLYKNEDYRRNQREKTLIAMKTPIAKENKSIAVPTILAQNSVGACPILPRLETERCCIRVRYDDYFNRFGTVHTCSFS